VVDRKRHNFIGNKPQTDLYLLVGNYTLTDTISLMSKLYAMSQCLLVKLTAGNRSVLKTAIDKKGLVNSQKAGIGKKNPVDGFTSRHWKAESCCRFYKRPLASRIKMSVLQAAIFNIIQLSVLQAVVCKQNPVVDFTSSQWQAESICRF
jgi:hypothetical protein